MTSSIIDELRFFQTACGDYYKTAREAATEGRKVAGYMCSYSPQELLHAAGYFPVRIIGRLGATPRADALMQSFICSFARSTFDAGLSGEFDFLDIMLFAHTCDTMQNLADLWQSNCPSMKTIIASAPNVHAGPASIAYYRKELGRVRRCIEAIAGPITDEKLVESIRLYGQHCEQMRNLYALRRACPQAMTGTEMMSVILSSFLVTKEEHLGHLIALTNALKNTRTDLISDRPKVIVGGSVCQTADFIAVIERAGCIVVDDDLCMGTRSYLLPPSPPCTDPMDALTQTYLSRIPCPAIHKPGFDPAALMLERVQQTHADGVVFLITKFCDPFGFDYPHVNGKLEAAGIPSLMLEVEQHLPVPEQMRTRVEAFVEILLAKKD